MTIKGLVENKSTLDYQQICTSLTRTFGMEEKVNWESVLPAQQQQEYFGGEVLRLITDHPVLSKQKDIRPIAVKKGSISQIIFFYVCLNDATLPKKQIQDITKKFISGVGNKRYVIWFFGDQENKQLKVALSAKEGKKVVLKTLSFGVSQPYYKTYDFILNEVAKRVNELFVEPTDLWKALWNAFDISIINRNFYDEIKGAFTDLLQQLNKKRTPFTNEEDKVQFAIRLVGRIIFCWFLKRKGVLHDAAISSKAVKTQEQINYYHNYYHDLLEPLFFDVLNTPDKERKGGLLKIIAHYPFLNGGLFEAQETDYKQHVVIDNNWFYNLFSKTLERYNFTVDENSSSNAEIAIDPEMLGRIFENLLAEQNPETGDSARKATGSFYTPREIVDYMVEQSISEFLKTALALDKKTNVEIEDFVHTQILPDSLAKYEVEISEALSKIKTLDPACGSGAFPIGLLQKIVALKQQLHPKVKNYKLKLDVIQSSIYGVDIQPMAVELSRLRCWLSLVVDEDPKDIKALPNLDFKFVCADSLVDVSLIDEYTTNALDKDFSSLEENVEQYFSPDYRDKKKIKATIEASLAGISKFYHNTIERFITQIKREEKAANNKKLKHLREKLMKYSQMDSKWSTYNNIFKNKKIDFFKTNLFFPSAKNGFDIVIGNPPYISGKSGLLTEEQKNYYNSEFETAEYQLDTYILFTERATKLTSNNGIVCFIMPNTWLANLKLTKIRKYLLEKTKIIKIITMPSDAFLSAVVDTVILVCKSYEDILEYGIKIGTFYNWQYQEIREVSYSQLLENNKYVFEININQSHKLLLSKIESDTQTISTLCDVSRGVHAYRKDGYGKSKYSNGFQTERDYLERSHHSQKKLDSTYFKEVRGKNVFPYYYEEAIDYVSYGNWLAEPRDWKYFKGERIYLRKIVGKTLYAALVNETNIADQSVYIAKPKSPNAIDVKYLLAVLNSKLLTWYFKVKANEFDNLFPQIKIAEFKELPIKKPIEKIQVAISSIAEKLIYTKKFENENTIHQSVSNTLIAKQLEEIIDGMVLELYFPEEMKSKNVNIIELVEKGLTKAESATPTESIYNFYKSVSHPDSEIRNRILSFAIVSPDILKPILQG